MAKRQYWNGDRADNRPSLTNGYGPNSGVVAMAGIKDVMFHPESDRLKHNHYILNR